MTPRAASAPRPSAHDPPPRVRAPARAQSSPNGILDRHGKPTYGANHRPADSEIALIVAQGQESQGQISVRRHACP